jgi:hypothetical protein
MKVLLGVFLVWSAGQTVGLGMAPVSGSPFSIPGLLRRAPQEAAPSDLSIIVGTAPEKIPTSPEGNQSRGTKSRHHHTITAEAGSTNGTPSHHHHVMNAEGDSVNGTRTHHIHRQTGGDVTVTIFGDTAATDPPIITITETAVTIVTPTNVVAATGPVNVVSNTIVFGGFGGVPGAVAASDALTAGAVVSGQAFGGVVGVVPVTTSSLAPRSRPL